MNGELVEEALEVLRKARETYKKAYILFSGGKDSLVVLDLATQVFKPSEAKIVFTEITGNTDELNVDYVYRVWQKYYSDYELIHLKRNEDFFEYMLRAGTPGPKGRWCMKQFKQVLWRRLPWPLFVSGMKRSDSAKRRLVYTSHFVRNDWIIKTNALPILNWTSRDVLDYVKERGLEVSPCYKIFGHSGNCMFCPFHNRRAVSLTLADPYWRSKILSYLPHTMKKSNKLKEMIRRRWLESPALKSASIATYLVGGVGHR